MPDSSDILWNDIDKDYGKEILELLLVDQSVTVAKTTGRHIISFGPPTTMSLEAQATASTTR